jgi:hypothetical protein
MQLGSGDTSYILEWCSFRRRKRTRNSCAGSEQPTLIKELLCVLPGVLLGLLLLRVRGRSLSWPAEAVLQHVLLCMKNSDFIWKEVVLFLCSLCCKSGSSHPV